MSGLKSSGFRAFAGTILCLTAMLGGGCRGNEQGRGWSDVGGPNPDAPAIPFMVTYGEESPFNEATPDNPRLDPNSDAMVKLLTQLSGDGFMLVTQTWSVPVFFADDSSPRFDVRLTAPWRPEVNGAQVDFLVDVPIPDWAAPDPEDDGHMVVVDTVNRFEYDFWQMKKEGGAWAASWGNGLSIDGDGVFPFGLSTRGSGFAAPAGVVWPEELEQGRIPHKLIASINDKANRRGGPVAPATESDAESWRPNSIPEGAILQLDPGLNLDSSGLDLTPLEKIIARALQEFGMIIGDNGAIGIELEAVQMGSFSTNPYKEHVSTEVVDEGIIFLDHISVDRLRVLKLPPQDSNPELRVDDPSLYR